MRVFITVLVLILSLQSWAKADDISEFQIEGMSVGGSLLDYFSKEEIEKFVNYDDLPSDMTFRIAEFYTDAKKMKVYSAMQVYYKPSDKKFIIYGVNGSIDCKNKSCEENFKKLKKDISESLDNSNNTLEDKVKHPDDKSGKSIYGYWQYNLDDGDITVSYTDWSKKMEYSDNVAVEIATKEIRNWINNNYGLGD